MARSRDCQCVAGQDRDTNYNECIDKIFNQFESDNDKLKEKIEKRIEIKSYKYEVFRAELVTIKNDQDLYNYKRIRMELIYEEVKFLDSILNDMEIK